MNLGASSIWPQTKLPFPYPLLPTHFSTVLYIPLFLSQDFFFFNPHCPSLSTHLFLLQLLINCLYAQSLQQDYEFIGCRNCLPYPSKAQQKTLSKAPNKPVLKKWINECHLTLSYLTCAFADTVKPTLKNYSLFLFHKIYYNIAYTKIPLFWKQAILQPSH